MPPQPWVQLCPVFGPNRPHLPQHVPCLEPRSPHVWPFTLCPWPGGDSSSVPNAPGGTAVTNVTWKQDMGQQ